jgi:hypothetical protein
MERMPADDANGRIRNRDARAEAAKQNVCIHSSRRAFARNSQDFNHIRIHCRAL